MTQTISIPDWKLTQTTSYYVNGATGNDVTNDGLSAGAPFATVGRALSAIPPIVEAAVTVNIAAGTYSEYLTCRFTTYTGSGSISIVGPALTEGPTVTINSIEGTGYGYKVVLDRNLVSADIGIECQFTDGNRSGTKFHILTGTIGTPNATLTYDMDGVTSRTFKTLTPSVTLRQLSHTYGPIFKIDCENKKTDAPYDGIITLRYLRLESASPGSDTVGCVHIINGGVKSYENVLYGNAFSFAPGHNPGKLYMNTTSITGNMSAIYAKNTSQKSQYSIEIVSSRLSGAILLRNAQMSMTYSGMPSNTYIQMRSGCYVTVSNCYITNSGTMPISSYSYDDANNSLVCSSTVFDGCYGVFRCEANSQATKVTLLNCTTNTTTVIVTFLSGDCSLDATGCTFTIVNPAVPMFYSYGGLGAYKNRMTFSGCTYSDTALVSVSPTLPDVTLSGTFVNAASDTLNITSQG